MDEGRNMILLFPSLIHLKDDEAKALFKPRYAPLLCQSWRCMLGDLDNMY
jgi:hypothetical protein